MGCRICTNSACGAIAQVEFFGSMFLVMASVSSIILFVSVYGSPMSTAIIAHAIAVAFVLCALIEILAPISGAHLNPVITVAMALESESGALKAISDLPFGILKI